jgi:hypothetical protein
MLLTGPKFTRSVLRTRTFSHPPTLFVKVLDINDVAFSVDSIGSVMMLCIGIALMLGFPASM